MAKGAISGAELIVSTLECLGVTTIFGVPGTQNVAIYEALRKSALRNIVATDELAAAFMANGYARGSGKLGVVTVIPGPGISYCVPALVEARDDSAAVLVITLAAPATGTVAEKKFRLQVFDQEGMLAPVVKEFIAVTEIGSLATSLVRAAEIALSGEPGPVVIQVLSTLLEERSNAPEGGLPKVAAASPSVFHVGEVVKILKSAKRPVLYCGQGAQASAEAVERLSTALGAPVLTTCSGRGVIPEDSELSYYADFSFGVPESAQALLDRSDLILLLGCKFTHNGSGGFKLKLTQDKLVHVDSSAEVLGANYPTRFQVQSDVGVFLERLLEEGKGFRENNSAWDKAELTTLKASFLEERETQVEFLPLIQGIEDSVPSFLRVLSDTLPRNSIITTDSGLHQALARSYLSVFSPRGLITPADFQSMGFGLTAAIGAKLAAPEREVVAIIGDGGFLQMGSEILTAVREGLSLSLIVFNDNYFGLIRKTQLERYGHESGVELKNPDFELFSKSLGATYFKLEGFVPNVIGEMLGTPGVKVLEVPLTDSSAIRAVQYKSLVREGVRGLLGERVIGKIKSLLGR